MTISALFQEKRCFVTQVRRSVAKMGEFYMGAMVGAIGLGLGSFHILQGML